MSPNGLLERLKRVRILPPRETEFYNLMERISDSATDASFWLTELFGAEHKRGEEIATTIENVMTRCLSQEKELSDLLGRAQQPPFARSEIAQYGADMVKIVKFINHAANRYVIYDIPSSDKEMRELAGIIREGCEQLVEATKGLRKDRHLGPFVRAIDELETRADQIYHGGLRRRFQEIRADRSSLETRINETPRTADCETVLSLISANVEYTRHVAVFFILRQVYAELERAIDSCSEAVDTLQRMVAENV